MSDDVVTAEKVYAETCNSIRATDDISFKLIGFIPLLSGGILTFLGSNKIDQSIGSPVVLSLALFAGSTTLALFRWELRNIHICTWLLFRAEQLEKTVAKNAELPQRPHPPSWFGKPEAAKSVYPKFGSWL